jgi:RHS repeat-associated protein
LININTSAAVYSYFGPQRFKKVLGSTTTRYIYSGSKPIAEYTGTTSPTLSTEYIYAGSQLLVTIAGSTTTYHHPDHLSNRAETNSSGTRTRTFGQLPFGDTWYETGAADKWKFTGYERDSGTGETGLDYANFRYYASGQGRFMSVDQLTGGLAAPQSLNRYAYTLNNPVNLVDPLGLDSSAPSMSWQCVGNVCTYTMSGGSTTDVFGEGGLFGGGGGSGGYYAPLLEGPGGGGGPTMSAGPPRNDCLKFADMVDQIAKSSNDLKSFMDKMASTFTGAKDSSISEMRAGANKAAPAATRGFRDSGFQAQFKDGSNQVRHFTGGLVAGYDLGYLAALMFMNSREVPGVDDPDIALNGQSTYAGSQLTDNNANPASMAKFGPLGMDYHDLAKFIRDKICAH